jgi:acyl carrier protein
MGLFLREFRWYLKRALDSGELKQEDKLDDVTDQLTQIFQCDSLDLVEIVMAAEEKGGRIRTVGELFRSLDNNGEDDTLSISTKR